MTQLPLTSKGVNIPEAIYVTTKYRIAQNFGGRKHWRIWRLGANSPKFFPPKFSITLVFYHCSTQSANVFSAKYILGANPPKFCAIRYVLPGAYTINRICSRNVLMYHGCRKLLLLPWQRPGSINITLALVIIVRFDSSHERT